jgi:NTE family protein
VGIALGAGSIRGYAHVGALRALERHEIPVDYLAGTSIGAIVAGLYARFGDLDRVADFLDGLGGRMFRPTVSRKSLLSTHAMRRFARKEFGDVPLEELSIPIAVVATDVDTQDEVVLRRGTAWRRSSPAAQCRASFRRCGSATGHSSTAASSTPSRRAWR